MVICTLTLVDDGSAIYEDSLLHRRADGDHVPGPLGGDALTRETAHLLSRWVGDKENRCRRAELQILGHHLYEIAFGGRTAGAAERPLGRAFERTFGRLLERPSDTERLRLRLVLGPAVRELATLPWEFLYKPGPNGFFLAGERTRLILTRYVPNSDRSPDAEDEEEEDDARLRILVVKSGPVAPGLGIVDADDVVEQVGKLESEQIGVRTLDTPSRAELRQEVKRWQPHIVHLIGHGQPEAIALRAGADERANRERIRAEQRDLGQPVNPVNEADWVDSKSVSTLLRQGLDERAGPGRLVFLHACSGDASLKAFNSVARVLADSERIAAVVAMQYEIPNDEAKRFARVFYSQLAEQMPVDEAVTVARRELGEISRSGYQSWDDRVFGTPVIYLRSSDPLFRRVRGALRQTAAPAAPAPVVAREKVLCPNPRCGPQVWVVPAAKGKCGVCKQPFITCPRPGCEGLVVVSEPGFSCTVCGDEYEGATTASDGLARPATSRTPSDPQPSRDPGERPGPPNRPGGPR